VIKKIISVSLAVFAIYVVFTNFFSSNSGSKVTERKSTEFLDNQLTGKPHLESYNLAFEIDTTGKMDSATLNTLVQGEIELLRRAETSELLGDSLESHIVFKILDASAKVDVGEVKSLNLNELNSRIYLVSPPKSSDANIDIKYTGSKISLENFEVVRLIVQNLHNVVLAKNSESKNFTTFRRDLYGSVEWDWEKSSGSESGYAYSFHKLTTDQPNNLEQWTRNIGWDYQVSGNLLTLKGSEKIELNMNGQHILDMDVFASFIGQKADEVVFESDLLLELADLITEPLVTKVAQKLGNAPSTLSFSDIKDQLLRSDPGPTYYSEVARVFSTKKLSEKEILDFLGRLKLNSSSYKAVVLGLAFSKGYYKNYLIKHIESVSQKQKMDLIPLLAQGDSTNQNVISYLKKQAYESGERNLKSAAALAMGTTFNQLNKSIMSGNISSREVFSLVEKGLNNAGSGDEAAIWLSALGNTGEARLVEIVEKYTSHKVSYVREKAYFALRNIFDKSASNRALKLLEKGLNDSDIDVRKRAAMATLSIMENANFSADQLGNYGDLYEGMSAIESSPKVRRVLSKISDKINNKM
jgi:hypothetical protein